MSEAEEETMKSEIKEYVLGWGARYSEWCVGVANNPRQRLFEDYHVNEKSDAWIYRTATSSDIARNLELYFIDLGAKSHTSIGNEDSQVYLYKINSQSSELI